MLPLGHMGITVTVVRVLESNFQSPWVDYRLLLVASLLPDLIDKPIGYFFNGRNYGHSLPFLLVMLIAALVQWYYRNNLTVLVLCIGAFIHDILDFVSHHEDWADRALFSTTILMAFEIIGGFLLICFVINLVLHNKISHFIETGEL